MNKLIIDPENIAGKMFRGHQTDHALGVIFIQLAGKLMFISKEEEKR